MSISSPMVAIWKTFVYASEIHLRRWTRGHHHFTQRTVYYMLRRNGVHILGLETLQVADLISAIVPRTRISTTPRFETHTWCRPDCVYALCLCSRTEYRTRLPTSFMPVHRKADVLCDTCGTRTSTVRFPMRTGAPVAYTAQFSRYPH